VLPQLPKNKKTTTYLSYVQQNSSLFSNNNIVFLILSSKNKKIPKKNTSSKTNKKNKFYEDIEHYIRLHIDNPIKTPTPTQIKLFINHYYPKTTKHKNKNKHIAHPCTLQAKKQLLYQDSWSGTLVSNNYFFNKKPIWQD
jgi:hypothetical protein